MRIPKVENYKNENKIENVKLTRPGDLPMGVTLMNEKEKVKLIKTVERIVRSSMEYRQYIKYLKDEIDMTKCSYFNNVSNKNTKGISIEIHHEPFTLFDITQTVLNKFIDEEKCINEFELAEEVMKVHYMGLVGLLPLSITVHKLVHNGKVFIPLQQLYGNFIKFLDIYDKYIPQETKDHLYTKLKMSKDLSVMDLSVLQKKYIYLEVDGITLPHHVRENVQEAV